MKELIEFSDPVFFLHHTQIDRLWYLWQQEDPEARYTDYSGIKTQDQFDGTIPPPSSIDDVLPMLGLADDLTVKDVMSTTVGPFCYSY
jgi:tyrosinase